MALEHGEITEQMIGAAFEVYSILGYGFLEKVYQRAMQVELRLRWLKAEIEDKIKVRYKNELVGDYQADVWVADSVIVELKVARNYQSEDEAQLLERAKGDGNPRRTPDQFRADRGRVQAVCLLSNSGSTAQRRAIVGVYLSVQPGVQPISGCDCFPVRVQSVFNPWLK